MPLSFFWQLLNQFLLSPWGLIVPMTLLITLFGVQQIQKTPAQIARFYADQLETADEVKLSQLLDALVRIGDAGIPGLVQGLTSNRESVFTASLGVLRREFNRWQESEQREHHFRVFAEALLHTCTQFSPAAQTEGIQFVDQMMQIRSVAATSPESTANRQQMIAHCEQILSQLESMRRRRIEPQDENFAPLTNTVASLNRQANQPVLLASNGQPFLPTSDRQDQKNATDLADAGSFNSFSVARADRLAAYQKSLQNRPEADSFSGGGRVSGIASLAPPNVPAGIEARIAQNFASGNAGDLPTTNIVEEYRNRIQTESGGKFGTDTFLTPELLNTPVNRVLNLSAVQLMQLLHHPDPSYVDAARRTLMTRDGFQESHLKLAWRLYHPIPAVRQEIVAMLPNTPNVQPSVWLKELLNDPNNDVRYRTASFLATTGDPALQRLLIDRGRRDDDPRITGLASRLDETQRGSNRSPVISGRSQTHRAF